MIISPLILFLLFVIAQRLIELVIARRNLAYALSQGAKEYGKEHYPLFFVLHISWIVAMAIEGQWRGGGVVPGGWLWLLLYALAQFGRYWAITSLGKYWNTRILILPGGERQRVGPYRFVKHPNYIVVATELLCGPLIFGAWITALIATLANAALLLLIRIPAEERALLEYESQHNHGSTTTPSR
jgi:methyltransferase